MTLAEIKANHKEILSNREYSVRRNQNNPRVLTIREIAKAYTDIEYVLEGARALGMGPNAATLAEVAKLEARIATLATEHGIERGNEEVEQATEAPTREVVNEEEALTLEQFDAEIAKPEPLAPEQIATIKAACLDLHANHKLMKLLVSSKGEMQNEVARAMQDPRGWAKAH